MRNSLKININNKILHITQENYTYVFSLLSSLLEQAMSRMPLLQLLRVKYGCKYSNANFHQ